MIISRFPHEFKTDKKDFGAVCLKNIAKYYGRYYTAQYLRDKCSIKGNYLSFSDLSHISESIGLRTTLIKATIDDLRDKLSLPCIIPWKENLYVVIYKISKHKVYISDPDKGLLIIPINKLAENWFKKDQEKGNLLLLEPMVNFKQLTRFEKQKKIKTLSRLLSYFLPYKKNFLILFVILLIVTLLQSILPLISKAIIDIGIPDSTMNFINLMLIANIVVIISITLSNIVRDWILLHITSRVNISLVSDYLIKLMKMPLTYFDNRSVGDILQRSNDHERIRNFMLDNSLSLIFSLLTFLTFSVILLTYNYVIFLFAAIGSLLYVGWVTLFLRIRIKLDWDHFHLVSKNQSHWVETISGIQDIKVNNYEKQKRWKWEAIQAQLYKINLKLLSVNNTQVLGSQFINSMQIMFITFYCARAVIVGDMTFGMMISTQFILGMLNGPVLQFVNFIQSAQYAKLSFARINEIQYLDDEDENPEANNIDLPKNKNLVIKDVSFKYTPSSPFALKDINLEIPHGKVTAIVGDSGSGKSTLLKLLLRLYKPTSGEIFVGNMNINNINLKQWRDTCGAVLQDGKIFNDTILNNIVLDEDTTDYDRLHKAVEIANIQSEIEELPQGYQTIIGEMGRGLSGGQKQRLLIARSLYKDPQYLFFDEATNALDTINEQKIVKSLDTAYKGKTVVVVAHRLSTIRKAHQIAVLRNGTIVELGDHETLVNNKGHYYDLIQSQVDLVKYVEKSKEELTANRELSEETKSSKDKHLNRINENKEEIPLH
jgi:ATP-binding cassette, subfamily B, bacterial